MCSFNPIYGQGMTVAAIEADLLAGALAEARAAGGLGPTFVPDWFARIAPVVGAAWEGVRIEDFRFPELADRRPASLRPKQWYMDRVQRATHRSAYATDRFYRVMNFLEPPTTLFAPRMILEAFTGRLRPNAGGHALRAAGGDRLEFSGRANSSPYIARAVRQGDGAGLVGRRDEPELGEGSPKPTQVVWALESLRGDPPHVARSGRIRFSRRAPSGTACGCGQ